MKNKKLILIGASTGGPGHLEKILSSLDANLDASIIIAQHIDTLFLPSLTKRLNDVCTLEVVQIHENQSIKPNTVHFIDKDISSLRFSPSKGLYLNVNTQASHYQPSVNALFSSASKLDAPYDILACLLTGIGDDGAEGMLALKNKGAHCIAESQDSSIVFGMPKVAFEIGASTQVMHLDKIIEAIKNF